MTTAAIADAILHLPHSEQVQIAGWLIQRILGNQVAPNQPLSLAEAAQLMRDAYLHDPELTALTVLDPEPLYEYETR